jgi:sulfonate transport system substrate-binding protein
MQAVRRFCALILAAALALGGVARAELNEVVVGRQYGLVFLQLMVMEHDKLLEKHLKAAGLDTVTVTWATFASGPATNDALLAGTLHFASAGVGPMVLVWAKTKGDLDVKAVTAMNSMPVILTTRNPAVKTIKDFTEKDRIALPAVKVSPQALTLQMAAEKAFGAENYDRLDPLTVAMPSPKAMAALFSDAGEINSHFGSPPFQEQELERPGVHTVLNSYDVLGGPATLDVVYTTSKFREANPKIYAAFAAAFEEATRLINSDKLAAAQIYLDLSKDAGTVEGLLKVLNDPQIEFTATPKKVMKYADFMYRIGLIKLKPASWQELFFPNAHGLPGS